MDETRNSLAIIINRSDYRESDSLLVVYTKDFGKLSLVARGAKKLNSKLSGHLEPLSLTDILIIKGRGFDYIGSALGRQAFLSIKDDLNKLYYAGLALRNFNFLVRDNEPDEDLFLPLLNFLEVLEEYPSDKLNRESGELLYIFFALKLLSELGYQPEMHNCLACHQKIKAGHNYFNLKNGGLLCELCFEKEFAAYRQEGLKPLEILTISDNCIKLMRFMTDNQLDSAKKLRLDKKFIKELSILVNNFISFRS
jgi:DNA repair protein RecO (recombination protein O)